MTTLTMYDAVDVAALPDHTTLTLGYLDGKNTAGHYGRVRRRFPVALIVATTVTGRDLTATMCDVERFDATPEQGAHFAGELLTARRAPTLYCSLAAWGDVRSAVARAKLPPGPVSYLVAGYATPPDPSIPRGAVGHQYATGLYDTSSVRSSWPGVLPAPLSARARFLTVHLDNHLAGRWSPPTQRDARALERLTRHIARLHQL